MNIYYIHKIRKENVSKYYINNFEVPNEINVLLRKYKLQTLMPGNLENLKILIRIKEMRELL